MDSEFANRYARLEEEHWWFRARRRILKALLPRDMLWHQGMRVLEIGCGPGGNLHEIYPDVAELTGLEPNAENAKWAAQHSRAQVHVGAIGDLPTQIEKNGYDVVCLFDVLEHIENDADALAEIKGLIRADGALALTVPAFMWLWGLQDIVSKHYRRYTRQGLTDLLSTCGFAVRRATYFNTFLFPAVAVARFIARGRIPPQDCGYSDFDKNPSWARWLLYRIFVTEASLLPHMNFPFGVSLYIVATVKKTE
jgi:SAM-dependent methyltransferase